MLLSFVAESRFLRVVRPEPWAASPYIDDSASGARAEEINSDGINEHSRPVTGGLRSDQQDAFASQSLPCRPVSLEARDRVSLSKSAFFPSGRQSWRLHQHQDLSQEWRCRVRLRSPFSCKLLVGKC